MSRGANLSQWPRMRVNRSASGAVRWPLLVVAVATALVGLLGVTAGSAAGLQVCAASSPTPTFGGDQRGSSIFRVMRGLK